MSPVRTATHPTLYRIHPVSFRDGNGDGVGDVRGMMAALPYPESTGGGRAAIAAGVIARGWSGSGRARAGTLAQ